jgi:D-alanine-D-alanine ligase
MEQFSQEILVEQFIPGREFAVGLLGNGNSVEILPIVEMDLKGDPNRIQTITDKKQTPVDKICPALLTSEQTAEIKRICLAAFRKLGLYDFTRVDFRMDKDGRFYVLELNSMASLGVTGSYYTAAKAAGYTYDTLINKILDVATLRYFGESHLEAESSEQIESQPLRSVVRSYIRSHASSNETLLEHFVNVNSTVTNLEDVNKLGLMLSKRLEHLGFAVKEHHEFDVGNMLYFTNHDSEENDVLLLSHLDTWYTNQDFTPFYKVGNKLYGSGIAESKGGLVTMLSALQALRFARKLKKIKCGILLISDDSLGGRFSKRLVHDISKISKYIIELKWGLNNGGIVTSCSGSTRYHIDLTHIRRPDETNKDVVPDMCRKIIAWKKISDEYSDARITISEFNAKTSFGRAPEYGRLSLESRYMTQKQGERFDSELRRIAKKKDKSKLDIHITKQVTREPLEKSENISNFYALIEKIAKQADIKINSNHRYATSSLCDVSQDIPMIGSMGPVGSDYRTPNEHILKDSLIDRGVLLALVLNKLTTKPFGVN